MWVLSATVSGQQTAWPMADHGQLVTTLPHLSIESIQDSVLCLLAGQDGRPFLTLGTLCCFITEHVCHVRACCSVNPFLQLESAQCPLLEPPLLDRVTALTFQHGCQDKAVIFPSSESQQISSFPQCPVHILGQIVLTSMVLESVCGLCKFSTCPLQCYDYLLLLRRGDGTHNFPIDCEMNCLQCTLSSPKFRTDCKGQMSSYYFH